MDTKGGRYTVKIDGARYSGRGKATLMLAGVAVKAEPNRDGSGYRTVEPKLYGIELSFDRGPNSDRIRWSDKMLLKSVDVTFVEDDVNISHFFTAGSWNGDPKLDTDNGEVSGMSVMSDQYSSR